MPSSAVLLHLYVLWPFLRAECWFVCRQQVAEHPVTNQLVKKERVCTPDMTGLYLCSLLVNKWGLSACCGLCASRTWVQPLHAHCQTCSANGGRNKCSLFANVPQPNLTTKVTHQSSTQCCPPILQSHMCMRQALGSECVHARRLLLLGCKKSQHANQLRDDVIVEAPRTPKQTRHNHVRWTVYMSGHNWRLTAKATATTPT